MKTQFEVGIQCEGVLFESPHEVQFDATPTAAAKAPANEPPPDLPPPFRMGIAIEPAPSDGRRPPYRHGRLLLTFPGDLEAARALYQMVIPYLVEHLRLFYPSFRVLGGVTHARRIPETEEEAHRIGDTPFAAEVHLQEVPDPVAFNPDVLRLLAISPQILTVMTQFNEARTTNDPISRFIGLFKVLELQFHAGRNSKRSLRNNRDFLALAGRVVRLTDGERNRPILQNEIPTLIDDLVNTRDRCAHLQREFGYAPHDPDVTNRVEPLGTVLEQLAFESILACFREHNAPLLEAVLASLSPGSA